MNNINICNISKYSLHHIFKLIFNITNFFLFLSSYHFLLFFMVAENYDKSFFCETWRDRDPWLQHHHLVYKLFFCRNSTTYVSISSLPSFSPSPSSPPSRRRLAFISSISPLRCKSSMSNNDQFWFYCTSGP